MILGGCKPVRRGDEIRNRLVAVDLLAVAERVVSEHPPYGLDTVLGRSRLGHIVEARAHVVYELVDAVGSRNGVATLLGLDCSTIRYLRAKWGRVVGDVVAIKDWKRRTG